MSIPKPAYIWDGTQWVPMGGSGGGASAYDIAVVNGFVGTEAEWLETIDGAPGGSIIHARWRYENSGGAPSTGRVRADEPVTTLWISETDIDGTNQGTALTTALVVNADVYISDALGNIGSYRVVSATDDGTYRTVTVTVNAELGTFPKADELIEVSIALPGVPGPTGSVGPAGGATIHYQADPPSSPVVGQAWIESDVEVAGGGTGGGGGGGSGEGFSIYLMMGA